MQNIVILGHSTDIHVARIAEQLSKKPIDIHYFSLGDLHNGATISWNPNAEYGALNLGTSHIPFDTIKSVYWNNANPNHSPISKEIVSALSPFFHNDKIRWVNNIQAVQYHQNKPRQLAHAKKLGATIPATFIGNCVLAAEDFISEFSQIIVKPVQGGTLTRELLPQEREIEGLRTLLNKHPITLQQKIAGDHVRTYVLGDYILSAIIQSHHLDYRDDPNAVAVECYLPKPISTLAKRICDAFGMAWCAIDWKLWQDEYVFLEANPCPHFAKFEDLTRYPIANCIAELLTE